MAVDLHASPSPQIRRQILTCRSSWPDSRTNITTSANRLVIVRLFDQPAYPTRQKTRPASTGPLAGSAHGDSPDNVARSCQVRVSFPLRRQILVQGVISYVISCHVEARNSTRLANLSSTHALQGDATPVIIHHETPPWLLPDSTVGSGIMSPGTARDPKLPRKTIEDWVTIKDGDFLRHAHRRF